MATLRKRGTKWQVQIRCGGKALSKSFSAKGDAEAWAKATEVSIQRALAGLEAPPIAGSRSLAATAPAVTLLDLLERYEATVTPTKRGHVSERYRLRSLKAHRIALLPIENVTPAEVASYRDERLTKVQAPSVRRELTVLRHCLRVAATEWGVVTIPDKNPVAAISKPSPGRPRDRRLTEEDARKISEGLQATRNPFIRHAITFAIATGMRRGELLSLTWANVDFTNRVAFLPFTKNGQARAVPLSSLAISVLTEVRRITTKQERPTLAFPLSPNALRLAWERLKRRAGIKDLRFHDLRHEAISRFFELGLSVPEVALISGHKDARMLFRYTHLKAEKVAEKLRGLAD